jgi:endonuclease/exonuclease/phosphatase family metal-dependent hydrolase
MPNDDDGADRREGLMQREGERRAAMATTIALAFAIVLLAPVARVLFPRLYLSGEDASFVVAGAIGLLVYAAPLLALGLLRTSDRTSVWLGVGLLVGARLAVQIVHPIPASLAFVSTVAALVGVTALVVGLGGRRSLRALPLAVVAGLALDTALRLPTGSWELVWQGGPVPAGVTLACVAAAAASTASSLRGSPDERPGVAAAALAAIGPFLMLQLIFLQNLGGVAASGRIGFPAALAVVLGGDVLAFGAAALVVVNRDRIRAPWVALAGLVAVTAASLLPIAVGTATVLGVVVLQVLVTGCLMVVAVRSGVSSRGRSVAGLALGSLGFLLLSLLWQLDIDVPLPFPRVVIPALAAAWLGVAAVRAAGRGGAARGSVAEPLQRSPLIGAGSVTALAVVIGVVTALVWPAVAPASSDGPSVSIMTFNVRGALGEDGMIDPDAILGSIRAADPDVVLLQEVARGWPIFGQDDLLARLTQQLGMSSRYEPAADPQFGNAILSRLPMTAVAAGPLPEVDRKQGRSYLAVEVATSAGPLLVINAHLESDAPSQIDALLRVPEGGTPLVIGGDMNLRTSDTANVGRFVGAGLVDGEEATGDACRTTSAAPTSACDRPDWVWVSRDLTVTGFATGAPSSSDHLPVVVTVTMP